MSGQSARTCASRSLTFQALSVSNAGSRAVIDAALNDNLEATV